MAKKRLFFLSLIILLVVLGNLIWGNPVSKHLVDYNAEKYLLETYPDKDFCISHVAFDFKTGNYNVHVISPSSIDTHFRIGVTKYGKILYDLYENDVLSKHNTICRIQNEYSNLAIPALMKLNLDYDIPVITATISFSVPNEASPSIAEENTIPIDKIQIDGLYNINDFAQKAGFLDLEITDKIFSYDQVVDILIAIKETMDQSSVSFHSINLYLSNANAISTETSLVLFEAIQYGDIDDVNLIKNIYRYQQ